MSVTTLSLVRPGLTHVAVRFPYWETALTLCAIFLTTAAVVPLVFDPSIGSDGAEAVGDPVSQPAWLLVIVLFSFAAIRVRAAIAQALMRNLSILGLCYLALLSALWSEVPAATLGKGLELTFITALGAYIGVRFGIAHLVRMLSWITLTILVLSVLFAVALPEYGLDALRNDAWRGVFTTKNELGRMMVFGGIVWATRGFAREVPPLRAAGIVGAFAVVAYQSQSRTALGVGLLTVGVFLLVWALSHTGQAWVPVKGVIVSILALAGVAVMINVQLLLTIVGADYSLTGRQGIWEAVWSAVAERPLLGYGYEAFWRGINGPSLEVWRFAQTMTPPSHNGYLQLDLGLGVLGLGLCLVAMVTVWRRALAELHRAIGSIRTFPLVFLSSIVLYNLTESGLLSGRSLQWMIFVAVATALVVKPHGEGRPASLHIGVERVEQLRTRRRPAGR